MCILALGYFCRYINLVDTRFLHALANLQQVPAYNLSGFALSSFLLGCYVGERKREGMTFALARLAPIGLVLALVWVAYHTAEGP